MLTPYLAVADARAAIAWYVDALGASQADEPIVMPDGRVGHAVLALGGAELFLADAHPELGVVAPSGSGNGVTLHLIVHDVDAVMAGAKAAGAHVDREPAGTDFGRIAVLRDPFGHRWMLNQR